MPSGAGFLPQFVTAGLMLLTLYFGTPPSNFARYAVILFGNQLY